MRDAREIGLAEDVPGLYGHSLRTTAATNALSNNANIAKFITIYGILCLQEKRHPYGRCTVRWTCSPAPQSFSMSPA